jgi:hypothetical protein
MPCRNGDIDGNLAGAPAHVAVAPREGAKLNLLPKLLAASYYYTPALWDVGEIDTMGSHLNGLLPKHLS